MLPPALVIAGTHSGVGKTTISIALVAALRRRGLRVQPFKVGPDFIDPTLHTRAAGRISRNLDGWMLEPAANLQTFASFSNDADIAVGVMGLFDGRDALTEAGSTAEMAKLLGLPVLLVVDAPAMARSAAALVHRYESFDQKLDVAGIIFNRVASPGHFTYLRESVEASCHAPVLGWLSPDESVTLPQRHLGLFMADEVLNDGRFDALVSWIERGVDIEALLLLAREHSQSEAIARVQRPMEDGGAHRIEAASAALQEGKSFSRSPRIGVARDSAFCFYYEDNLDLLASFGAHVVEFSPVSDGRLPEMPDGIYFGGGYPELNAAALAENETMRADVARFAQSGKPVYAECGGLMYLTQAIINGGSPRLSNGRNFSDVCAKCSHILPHLAMQKLKGRATQDGCAQARGHEFRYSVIDEMPKQIPRHYRVSTMAGERKEGFAAGAVLASYGHLHFGSCPRFAARFVAACAGS